MDTASSMRICRRIPLLWLRADLSSIRAGGGSVRGLVACGFLMPMAAFREGRGSGEGWAWPGFWGAEGEAAMARAGEAIERRAQAQGWRCFIEGPLRCELEDWGLAGATIQLSGRSFEGEDEEKAAFDLRRLILEPLAAPAGSPLGGPFLCGGPWSERMGRLGGAQAMGAWVEALGLNEMAGGERRARGARRL